MTNIEIIEKVDTFLKQDKNIKMFKKEIITNKNLTEETLDKLSQNKKLLKAVASNENVSTETLSRIATDNPDKPGLCKIICSNINTSPEILKEIYLNNCYIDTYDDNYQEWIDVLVSIGNNINLSESILEELADANYDLYWIFEDALNFVLKNVKKIKEAEIDNIKNLIDFINLNAKGDDRINILYMLSNTEKYSELIFDNVILERFVSEHEKTRELFENSDFYIKDLDDEQYYSIIERSDFIDLFCNKIINKNNYELKSFIELFFNDEYYELLEDE